MNNIIHKFVRAAHHPLALLLLTSCAVEAGNPTGKKPKGNVTVSFLQTTSLSSDQFTLPIAGVYLSPANATNNELKSLNVSSDELELLSTSSDSKNLEAASAELEAGNYNRVVIKLPDSHPPRFKDSAGREEALATNELQNQSFSIEQDIVITAGETTSVVIRLDPFGSLAADGSGKKRFRFDPRGDAFPKPPLAKHTGTANIADAAYVCAYAYNITRMPPPGAPNGPSSNPGSPGAVTPAGSPAPQIAPNIFGYQARPHRIFATRAEIAFDTTAACNNAFVKTTVKDKSFVLDHLLPGSYALRFFRLDDTYVDQAEDIAITPPAKLVAP